MKKTYYYIIAIFLVLAIFSEIFIIATMKNQITKIENGITHLDKEVDEVNSGVKRILNRDSFYQSLKNSNSNKLPKVKIDSIEYDFGAIERKGGSVNVDFNITNNGDGELILGDITTSCGCTTAKISNDKIAPGESAILTVYFNPDFHEEPLGRIMRSIFVPTNDPGNKELEFKIFVEIKN